MIFSHVIVGGTFDHIHKGHRHLLLHAFASGNYVTIGLTTDAYVQQHKQGQQIRSYKSRKHQLEDWLMRYDVLSRAAIVPIDDAIGPAGSSIQYDAIVVSQETKSAVIQINAQRRKQGLPLLVPLVIPLITAEDEEKISSTRIRLGEIDENGRLVLPRALRERIRAPIGTLMSSADIDLPIGKETIAVGDTTVISLYSKAILPTLVIVDFQVKRKPFAWDKTLWNELNKGRKCDTYISGPGYIAYEVMKGIKHWAAHPIPQTMIINGEEDLLVLPVLYYVPLGSIVWYGQPNKGIVQVEVTPKTKKLSYELLNQFILQRK